MIIDILKLVGLIAIWLGILFNALGVVGLLRLPDVYSRLHATSKVATLGLIGLLIGVILIMGQEAILRAIALGVFMLITAPMAGHVIAAGAHQAGVPMVNAVRDDMDAEFAQSGQQTSSSPAASD